MYQKIYDIVEKKGRVKTGILLNGENAGLKYLAEEDYFECSGTFENALLQNEKTILKNAVSQAAGTGVMKAGEQEIFVETYEKNPRLIILGGGHVSQPVAEIGRLLGFHITVMDDRADPEAAFCLFRNDRKQDKSEDHPGKASGRRLHPGAAGSDSCTDRPAYRRTDAG